MSRYLGDVTDQIRHVKSLTVTGCIHVLHRLRDDSTRSADQCRD